jgi:hypothetical protein
MGGFFTTTCTERLSSLRLPLRSTATMRYMYFLPTVKKVSSNRSLFLGMGSDTCYESRNNSHPAVQSMQIMMAENIASLRMGHSCCYS